MTGYNQRQLAAQLKQGTDFETFVGAIRAASL